MTSAVMPLLPETGMTPGATENEESPTQDFDELLVDNEAPAEEPALPLRPASPPATSASLMTADSVQDPAEDTDLAEVVPLVLIASPLQPLETPPPAAQELASQAVTDPLQQGGQAPQAERTASQLFEIEELPPPSADGEPPVRPTAALAELGAEAGDSEDGASSLLSEAAQAFDVETAELDGLLEPEAIADAPAETAETPELPVHDNGRLRVTVDEELSIEISKRGGRIDVAIDGSTSAVREIQDLGPELAASLAELGFELGEFHQQEREGEGEGKGSSGSSTGDPTAETSRKARGGRLVNRRA